MKDHIWHDLRKDSYNLVTYAKCGTTAYSLNVIKKTKEEALTLVANGMFFQEHG
jgi:hypothetical protein